MTSMASVSEAKERTDNLNNSKIIRIQKRNSLKVQCGEYEDRLSQAEEQCTKLKNSLSGCQLKLESRKKKRDSLKEKADKLNLDYQERLRRIRILEDLERNMEGFYNSVKLVIKEADRGNLSGIRGPVSRIISVPQEYAVAVETALGNSMQHIVTSDEESAKAAINYLKHQFLQTGYEEYKLVHETNQAYNKNCNSFGSERGNYLPYDKYKSKKKL